MLVARTDPDAPKHKGLTYFLMDMEQDGVEVVPLRQITGESEFNELFIDGARDPGRERARRRRQRLEGRADDADERARRARASSCRCGMRQLLDELIGEAADRGLLDDPVVADRLGELHLRTRGAAADRLPRADRDRDVRPARARRAR